MEKRPHITDLFGPRIALFENEADSRLFLEEYPNTNLVLGVLLVRMCVERPDAHHIRALLNEDQLANYWNRPEVALWMAGFALNKSDEKDLRAMQRGNGEFYERYGWQPMTMVTGDLTPHEMEQWTHVLLGEDLTDDEHIHEALNKALKEDFEE